MLKVKVGLDTDEATIEAVRSVTKKPLRVDANEGWKDKEEAVRKINWLEKQGVEFVEQPMPAAHARGDALGAQPRAHPDHRRRSLPARRATSRNWPSAFDGVNIKLDKARRHAGSLPHDPDRASRWA